MCTLDLVDHRCLDVTGASRREELGRNAEDLRDGAVRLFASASVLIGQFDQSCLEQHAHMEVEVAGIDSQSLGELAVRELPFTLLAEHLQHTDAQRMAERF